MVDDIPAVRAELERAMATAGWSSAALAKHARVDPATVGDFLSGKTTWPQRPKRAAIEAALDWLPGTMDALRRGEQIRVRPSPEDASHVLLDLPDEVLEGLTEVEREEVRAAARLAALSKAREIRGG